MDIAGPPICFIFLFSFALPLLLGIWSIRRFEQDKAIVALGSSVIFIGFVLSLLNAVLISLYWFSYSGMEMRMFFVTVMMELLFIPLMLFGGLKVRRAMIDQEDWRRHAKWLSISLAAVLTVTAVGGFMIPVERTMCRWGIDISISANVTGSYYLYIPAPLEGDRDSENVSEIVHELQFIVGDGDSSIVSTEHGPALRISSTGSANLSAKGESEYESFYEVSLRNTSYTAHARDFWVFTSKSFNETIHIEIYVYSSCFCASMNFHLETYLAEDGWSSHEGYLDGAIC